MIVKKYQGQTETEAIKKAQEELGNKAIVLNVKTLKQRGIFKLFKKDLVEITAAVEEEGYQNVESVSNNNQVLNKSFHSTVGTNTSGSSQPITGVRKSSIDLVADDKLSTTVETSAIEEKLDYLHNLLQKQINSGNINNNDNSNKVIDSTNMDSVHDMGNKVVQERENTNMKFIKLIYGKLIDNEVSEEYADLIMKDIESSLKKESNIDSILAAVYQKIILKLGEPRDIVLGNRPKVVFFIGPTGVGKTTTIAKVASRYIFEMNSKVAFITSDTYRIAAIEQLNTYAGILDSPVSVVYSADELEKCMIEYKDYDLIMVDTAGRSHKCNEQMDDLTIMLDKVKDMKDDFDIQIYLVLSVTTKYKDLVDITQRYQDIEDWAILFTKLDETCSLGNILNIRLLTGAPLSYTTSGQNVPDDIELVDEQALARQLLGGNE